MLDPNIERTVNAVCEHLRGLFGPSLVTVALYGSAVGEDFVPGTSDLNLALVLERADYTSLHILRELLPRWRKQRFATPLVLDRDFLSAAADIFPLELSDLKATHHIVYGANVFGEVVIRREYLRAQCRREAHGKLLRLRELYLEVGGRRDLLQALMLDSLKTFLVIFRAMNRAWGDEAPDSYRETLTAFEKQFARELPAVSELLDIKLNAAKWSGDAEVTFRNYVGEVEALVRIVDLLPRDNAAASR